MIAAPSFSTFFVCLCRHLLQDGRSHRSDLAPKTGRLARTPTLPKLVPLLLLLHFTLPGESLSWDIQRLGSDIRCNLRPCSAASRFLLGGAFLAFASSTNAAYAATWQRKNDFGISDDDDEYYYEENGDGDEDEDEELDRVEDLDRPEEHQDNSFSNVNFDSLMFALHFPEGHSLLDKIASHVIDRPQYISLGWDAGGSLADEIGVSLLVCDHLWTGRIDTAYENCVKLRGAAELAALFKQEAEGKYTKMLVHGTLFSIFSRVRTEEDIRKKSKGIRTSVYSNPWAAMPSMLDDFLQSRLAEDIHIELSELHALKMSQEAFYKPHGRGWLSDQKAHNIETWYQEFMHLVSIADGPGMVFHMEESWRYGIEGDFWNFSPTWPWDAADWICRKPPSCLGCTHPPLFLLLHFVAMKASFVMSLLF